MEGEVIKSFLVGLGFEVDDASLKKFNQSIAQAAIKVTALFTATQAMTAGIVAGISKVSEGFEQMGYEYRLISPMINKTLMLRREMLKAYSQANINIYKVIQNSVRLNFSLAKTKFAFEALYKGVASRFFPLITKQSDIFRAKLYANMPKIQAALEKFIKFIFKAFEAVTALGVRLWSILTRVYDFFVALDKATDGWSTIILGVVAAWKLLNLSFLASPLGMILSLGVALLALYDDFKTWQEGGKSLFNWTKFIPVIDAVNKALSSMVTTLRSLMDILGNVVLAFYQLYKGDFSGAFDSIKEAAKSLLGYMTGVWDMLKNIFSLSGTALKFAGNAVSSLFGNSSDQNNSAIAPNVANNLATNFKNNPAAQPLSNPVSSNVQNSQTNQHVSQQTNISVQGGPDANSTGKAVASEQNRINFDMIRNMKGATR